MQVTTKQLVGVRQVNGGQETVAHPTDQVYVNSRLMGYCGHHTNCHISFCRPTTATAAAEVLAEVQQLRKSEGRPEPVRFVLPPDVPQEIVLQYMPSDDTEGDEDE